MSLKELVGRGVVFALAAGFFAAPDVFSQIIPADRRIDWAGSVGVPGGIPNRTTIYATLNPGATVAQINSALASCPSNQVVFLNAGTYTLSGAINFGTKHGTTLRGAGMRSTILNFTGSGSACIDSAEFGFAGLANISSGYTKGSTSIVMAGTPAAGFRPGNIMQIRQNDDTSFVFSSTGPGTHMQFLHRITSVSGTTINFEPPLAWTFSSSLSPQACYSTGPGIMRAGLEDFSIRNVGPRDDCIKWTSGYQCWFKGLEVSNVVGSALFLYDSLQCTIRSCYMHSALGFPNNPDGYGVSIYGINNTIDGTSSFNLVEDNIFAKLFVSMWQTMSSGNAFIYNFCTNAGGSGFSHQQGTMNAGHGAHPMMCLWEGNIGEQWQHDGYHGSASHQTVFRNWIHGLETDTDNRKMMDITRGSYHYNVVGNVLGHTSWTPNQYEMTGSPGYADGNVIWRLGYPNVANNSFGQGNPWPSTYGLTYPDAKSKSTLLRHGNYDYYNRSIAWDPAISDHAIPNSLFYNSKPAYFGNLPWPAFDPGSPGSASMTNIPAGYRFRYGFDPATGPVNNAPTVIANASPRLGTAPLAVSFSSAGSSDPEGTALTYNWTFGDGTPNSTAANPSHSYTSNGSYFARLTVSDGTNQVTSADINIRVGNQPPVIAANATPTSGPAPLAVAFSSSGSSDPEGTTLTYSWDFGDGSSVSTAANPAHTYQANGVYTARLTISDGTTPVSSNLVITVSNGLVAAYDFDAGSGAILADASGNANSGAISGATWATAGKYGRALSFNGVSAVVTVPSSAELELTTGVTLEAWVYPTSFNADYQSIVTKPIDSSFNGISYVLQGASRPTSVPSFATSVSPGNLLGPSTLPLNTWSHLAGTYDGITARLYINGVQVNSQAQSGTITTSPEGLRIGLGWAGMIDELRIYNRALSATDVQRDMNTPVGGAARPSPPSGFRVVGP